MSILLFSTAWLLLASASLWRCGNTTKEDKEIKGLLKHCLEFLHNGLCYIHSSLKRGSALGPTLPNVLMISMCKECWSWYWGSSKKDANCIFTRSSSYTEYTNERRTVKIFLLLFFLTPARQLVCVPTSFCVTVSMMVPKAGMVDILTELEAARKQSFTIHAKMCQHFRHFLNECPKEISDLGDTK